MPLNKAEEVVDTLCRRSFLSLWSYANPKGKNGKELCDVLVACDPHVVIFSVKNIKLGNSGDASVDWSRWRREAIDGSVKQIHGAERWLKRAPQVVRSDGQPGLDLPTNPTFHRIAVALGAKREVAVSSGDFGKGLVHVLDEFSLPVLLKELDTVGDFVDYLTKKEQFLDSTPRVVIDGGGEEDLLAMYLHSGRSFPVNCEVAILTGGIWKTVSAKTEFKARQEADRESYIWDRLIDTVARDAAREDLEIGSLSESELILRTMARETRFNRRILAHQFDGFMREAARGTIDSRIAGSPSGITYVFLALPKETNRATRVRILELRCYVARGMTDHLGCRTVVGIATERYRRGQGFSLDLVFLQRDKWEAEDQRIVEGIQRELGYFASPRLRRVHMDEFPGACPERTDKLLSR